MKIALLGLTEIPLGNHNLRDPRLDAADKLVEAKKKTYAQVEVTGEDGLLEAECILTNPDGQLELVFRDIEFIETRLGRDCPEDEKAALLKLKAELELDKTVFTAGLTPEEKRALIIHGFSSNKPIVVPTAAELNDKDALLLRAFREGGYICFLTVGGKENRAWPIRKGSTAAESGGTIHTDIQKGFIRAEIISYDDFIASGGETQAKHAGKQRLEMKNYIMQDYDVANFRFNK